MKKSKALLILCTIMVMLAVVHMNTVFSSAEENKLIVTIGSVQAKTGDTVEVPITFTNVPMVGMLNTDFELGYDQNVLDVNDILPGDIVINSSRSFNSQIFKETGRLTLLYSEETGYGREAIKTSGVFAKIIVTVKDNAPIGTIPIVLVEKGAFADYNLKAIPVSFVAGQVEISGVENSPVSSPAASIIPTITPTNVIIPSHTPTVVPATSPAASPIVSPTPSPIANTPNAVVSTQPQVTPVVIEEPVVEIPHGDSVDKHMPFLRGYPEGLFKPENNITRAEAAVIFAKLLGADENTPVDSAVKGFSDMKEGHWAAWAVKYVSKEKLFSGYPDGTFMPNKSITRAEFATVVYKFLEKLELIGETSYDIQELNDVDGHWAQKNIETLVGKGYIRGYEDKTFRPQANIKRSESVALINRSLQRGPLYGAVLDFKDVPENYWAYKDIAEGVIYHSYKIDENGHEIMLERLDD